jgi:hypothetical protein
MDGGGGRRRSCAASSLKTLSVRTSCRARLRRSVGRCCRLRRWRRRGGWYRHMPAMESFQSKPSRQLATRSAPLPASLAEPSRTMLRVARLPHVRPNHVRLSTRGQTSEPDPFSLSIFHKKAMLAHRPVAPLDHRAFRVTLMMMRERPDAGGCCAGPIWEEAGQHPAVPCRGGSAAGS